MASNENDNLILGVHELSEFVFCPRAGLICHGEQIADTGEDESVSNLDYMPMYELREISLKLGKLSREIVQILMGLLAGALMLLLAVLFLDWTTACFLSLLTLSVAIYPLRALLKKLSAAYRLYQRQCGFTEISQHLPNLNHQADEELDWRAILRCRFDLQRCQDPFVSPELGLAGRPWKLLKKNNLCIPVFKCRPTTPKNPNSSEPSNWLYQQHYVRIAAYCALIENCTDSVAPFGLVLFSGTYQTLAIKVGPETTAALDLALEEAKATIIQHAAEEKIDPPGERLCRSCPEGFPKKYIYDLTILHHDGRAVEPQLHLTRHDKRHSRCGDLFRWVPPHKKAAEFGLTNV